MMGELFTHSVLPMHRPPDPLGRRRHVDMRDAVIGQGIDHRINEHGECRRCTAFTTRPVGLWSTLRMKSAPSTTHVHVTPKVVASGSPMSPWAPPKSGVFWIITMIIPLKPRVTTAR